MSVSSHNTPFLFLSLIQEEKKMNVSTFVDQIKVPFSMCVASKRNTGKSVLLNELIVEIMKRKMVNVPVIFSNTTGLNDDYPDVPMHLKQPFSEEALQRLIKHQKDTPKEKRKEVLVLFDDVLGDKKARHSDLILYCYAIGRHININPILASQVPNHVLTPTIKANSDYILISRLNRSHIENVWEALTNIDKIEFVRFIEQVNKDYMFCIADLTSQSNDPHDFLSLVRATPPPKKKKLLME
jgi:hypothetical protein